MLNKDIEWLRVIMKRNPGTPIPHAPLPEGFSFVDYRDGDASAWAEIETSAGSFDSVKEAESYFLKEFAPRLRHVHPDPDMEHPGHPIVLVGRI